MKKKLLIIGGIVLVICIIVAIVILSSKKKPETFRITVTTNGGVNYDWKYKLSNEDIVEIERSKEVRKEDRELEGGIIYVHYDLTAKKKGDTTLTLEYVGLSNNDKVETKIFNINVDNNLKITVNEQKD